MDRISSDQAMWTLHQLVFLAHVDDILIIGSYVALHKHISSKFKFNELGPTVVYIGIYIIRDRPNKQLFLDQAPYVNENLGDFKMTN